MAFKTPGQAARVQAHNQQQQQTAQNRQSQASAVAEQRAAGPNFRTGVTPDMSPDQARFTQAQAVQNYGANQRGTQNYAADVTYGMKTGEARSTQANAFRSSQQGGTDMSAYGSQGGAQKGGAYSAYSPQGGQGAAQSPYNASNVPRTPPKGAQQNDLSGNVPSNQMWAQAYNQASNQYGGNTQAQSWTMPGSSSSQSYNPATGQYGQATSAPSNAGNMAYNSIDSRPAPIQASATGIGGNQMPWQDAMSQREAFAGNLSQRLGQYSGGQLTGPVTFDPSQLMQQANDQLANGTFSNQFSQNQPVQQAMGNATQYMQGNFQNPFGNSPQANNPQPSWGQQSYDPQAAQQSDPMSRSPATWSDADLQAANQAAEARARQQASRGLMDGGVRYYRDPATGKVLSDSFGGRGQDATANWNAGEEWRSKNPTPTVYSSGTPSPRQGGMSYDNAGNGFYDDAGFKPQPQPTPSDTIDFSDKNRAAAYAEERRRSNPQPSPARPIEPPAQGTPYNPQAAVQGLPDVPAPAPTRVQYGYRAQANPVARPTQAPQPDAKQSQLAKIDSEINKWQRATYGTRTGGGPPAEWYSHIQALQRLRTKAEAGDAAALAWNPKMKAPPPNVTPTVPLNRRGSAARFGGLMQNGDNRR